MTEVLDRSIQRTEPVPLRQRLVNDPDLDLFFERVTQSRPTLKDRLLLDPDLDLFFDNITKSRTKVEPGLTRREFLGRGATALATAAAYLATQRVSLPTQIPEIYRTELSSLLNPENNIFKKIGIMLYERALAKRFEAPLSADPELNRNRINILLLGLGIEKEKLTDTNMVLSYSIKDNKLSLISIPRDTHAPEIDRYKKKHNIAVTTYNSINSAYETGEMPLVREIVPNATGLYVDYYLVIDIKGFMELVNDTVGEIEVDIGEDFEGDPVFVHALSKGKQKLDPDTLQQYLRARQSTSDSARNWRQQDVLGALFKAFKSKVRQEKNLFNQISLFAHSIGTIGKLKLQGRLDTDLDLQNIFLTFLQDSQSDKTDPIQQKLVLDMDHGLNYAPGEAQLYRPHLYVVREGDPNGQNLSQTYWKHFRSEVKKFLT